MTLTKYQRGDPMEGWNDCPTPMMIRSQNSSQSSIPTTKSTTKIRQDCDKEDVLKKLEKIFNLEINLPEKEKSHYETKLKNTVSDMSQRDLGFINNVCEEILSSSPNLKNLKSEVVDHMMNNDGVSTWCSPLKKIVSSIKI
ncbi:uncharacterized protein KGF55_005018 [Candida pseudojiufengensis]|uniref:uncharacterized protein n=1 Tax=Candida pseudojiufengensis TaxID=497109 RepID=UPI002225AD57|nr:uncharacterized protein KGF55_005018 [Candida pseudojiufengensis]KAI5959786.1 hypothetical protein KGF55_005018 [Candida pseudojiufengensis]